jgi:hypothetical protein
VTVNNNEHCMFQKAGRKNFEKFHYEEKMFEGVDMFKLI